MTPTIKFATQNAMAVFTNMLHAKMMFYEPIDEEPKDMPVMKRLLARINNAPRPADRKSTVTVRLDEDMLDICRSIAESYVIGRHPDGKIEIEPPPMATIKITRTEMQILTKLLFNAANDVPTEADPVIPEEVAVGLLEKLRQAVFQ